MLNGYLLFHQFKSFLYGSLTNINEIRKISTGVIKLFISYQYSAKILDDLFAVLWSPVCSVFDIINKRVIISAF